MKLWLGKLGVYESSALDGEGTEPLGVGEFLGEGVMALEDVALEFDHMVGELFSFDNHFVGCKSHIILFKFRKLYLLAMKGSLKEVKGL